MLLGVPARRAWDLPGTTDGRIEDRSNVFLSAALVTSSSSVPVRIRNLSSRGALLDGAALPVAGVQVQLVRGMLRANGHVAWQDGSLAGINFGEEIDVGAWVRRTEHSGQQRVDSVVAALKRDEALPHVVTPASPPTLRTISFELNQIGIRLASMPGMTAELGEELIKLDSLAQSLRQLAERAGP